MDRRMLMDHLALAEQHVEQGKEHIDRQTALIAKLECNGYDSALARKLLGTFQDLQALHTGDRDRLHRELVDAKD